MQIVVGMEYDDDGPPLIIQKFPVGVYKIAIREYSY